MSEIRKIVSKKIIDKISPIEGADFLEVVTIGGWKVVVRKGEFSEGDKVIYFEVDAFLPKSIKQFEFLMKSGVKTVLNNEGEEITGHWLRTIKLRKQISQGLILPFNAFPELSENSDDLTISDYFNKLGVFKYEKPLPVDGGVIGSFPDHLTKTDSIRVQNLTDEFIKHLKETDIWYATEKIDGMSTTWWKESDGKLRVASRNYELDIRQDVFKEISENYKLNEYIKPGFAIQAELYGEGIQGNPLKVKGKHLAIFNWEGGELPEELQKLKTPEFSLIFPNSIEEALEQANKIKSKINPTVEAEGIVWWSYNRTKYDELGERENFKSINNNWLLKNEK